MILLKDKKSNYPSWSPRDVYSNYKYSGLALTHFMTCLQTNIFKLRKIIQTLPAVKKRKYNLTQTLSETHYSFYKFLNKT